jgi:hypothetical protein
MRHLSSNFALTTGEKLIEQLRADYGKLAHHKLASVQLDRVEAMG